MDFGEPLIVCKDKDDFGNPVLSILDRHKNVLITNINPSLFELIVRLVSCINSLEGQDI